MFLLLSVFIIGYLAIAFEHPLNINKSASALIAGVLCWLVYLFNGAELETTLTALEHQTGEIAGILFFLLGAMTIVELIDAHDGFDVIVAKIKTTNTIKLLWIVSILAFFLSAVLDNLTTSIVMATLLAKIIKERNTRLLFAGMVIIAANAGGAWSPIGDVTTTMLWIGGQISATNIMAKLFLPSLVSLLVPLLVISFRMRKEPAVAAFEGVSNSTSSVTERNIVFYTGLLGLLFVPVFKTITHLPPYMGMLLSLGVLWVVTELIHKRKNEADRKTLSVVSALERVDVPSVLFFLGILLSVGALQVSGILSSFAQWLDTNIGDQNIIVMGIGVLSSIVDNVPLVSAAMGMYHFPTDHYFWEFLAYCAGTGGSILIIGSAAGVTVMGIEKINFFTYLKKISLWALLGYFAGAVVYILQESLF